MYRRDWELRAFAWTFVSFVEWFSGDIIKLFPFNDFYYASCGAINLLALLFISGMKRSALMVDLAVLAFAQLCLQAVGWLLYSCYFHPDFYNWSIRTVVLATYARILWVRDNDRNYKGDPNRELVFSLRGLWPRRTSGVSK